MLGCSNGLKCYKLTACYRHEALVEEAQEWSAFHSLWDLPSDSHGGKFFLHGEIEIIQRHVFRKLSFINIKNNHKLKIDF